MAEITVRTPDGAAGRFPLTKERVTIGRSRESDIFLPDQWLSRHHAEIRMRDGGFVLVDLGSKNGTLLNGQEVTADQRLRTGDVITLGEHHLTFSEAASEDEEAAPEGTRVFSARELSDVRTKPSLDPEDLARQSRVLSVLRKAMDKLVQHRPLQELFDDILNLLFEAVSAERAAILLLEGSPPVAVVKAARARKGQIGELKVSRSIVRKVVDDRKSLLIPNLMEDAAFSTQESILSSGIRSAMCAPLWYTGVAGAPSSPTEMDSVIGLVYMDSLLRAGTFSEEDLRVVTALANLAAAKIENVRLLEESIEKRRLEEDMRVAADIQRKLLPEKPPTVPGYGVMGSNTPSRSVGGDYYDFGAHEGQLLFALGDVSGKGTGAALLMTVLRAAVRAHWHNASLAEAMGRINDTVAQNVTAGKYVTFFLGRIDPATGDVRYVNAGHNPPVIVRTDGSHQPLTDGGMVLGMFEGVPYTEGGSRLEPGDALVVFSDGVTETWNPQDEEFGEDKLLETMRRCRDMDADALHASILLALDSFAAGRKPSDDRTMIVIKRDRGGAS